MKIYGEVIDVSFRYYTCEKAKELGLIGYVRNCRDLTVEIEVEGEEDKIQKLLTWVKKGPPGARVHDVEFEWSEGKDEFGKFEIRY